MAHAAGDAHEYPVYGAHFRVGFPILDADGDIVTGATSPDSEVSKDAGTFADCTNEATEIATASGMYYLDLTGLEMTAKQVEVIVKSGNGKTTALSIRPIRLPILESGTAQAGAAGTITLAAGASAVDNFYNGLFVLITNDSPAGAQYQLRRVISYVGSTRVATVDSNWGTNPSVASTYDILIPEGYAVATIAPDAISATALAAAAATEIADALLARDIETGWTVKELMSLMAAALLGKLSGAATTTVTIRDVADAANRIVATVDSDGNRTAVTLTPV